MNYVDSFNLFGVEAKQIPCIKGEGVPTTTTEGAVGCFYMDTTNGDVYKCVGVNDEGYIWEIAESGASDEETKQIVNAELEKYFTTKTGNLYNPNDQEEENGWVNPVNGTVTDNAQLVTTGYIPIENGKTYTAPIEMGMYGYSTTGYFPIYNANKEYIARVGGEIVNGLITITIDNAEAAYLRQTISRNANEYGYKKSNWMFVEGDAYPDRYCAYGDGEKKLNNDVIVPNISPLKEKTVVFTGDSICNASTDETGVRGWAQRIGEKHDMNWTNAGISGATITSKDVTNSTGSIADTNFGENPDYIIIEGGTNDADLIGGKDTNGNMPANFGSYNNTKYDTFDTSTFCGAVEHLFKRVTTDYAGAKIGFIIAHKMGGSSSFTSYDYSAPNNNRRFYFETIIELCKKWGIPYIDLWNGCYLNPQNPAHNSGDDPFYYNGDRQHLTAKGYDYITPMIEKWMETL